MAEKGKPLIDIRTTSTQQKRPATPLELRRQRTAKQLEPMADQIAENAALMERFRATIGSEDKALGWQLMEEVTKAVQSIDPSITYSEATRIAMILFKKLRHFK